MTFDEYQNEAMRTASHPSDDESLLTAALGLCGESGEVADRIKKWRYHGHELGHDDLVKELGDVLWYLALAAEHLGVSLESVAQANINKLWARYPDGFDSERSKNRDS